ncbi:MAG: peptidoglycan -binding protein [Rhodospirillales bacterium]
MALSARRTRRPLDIWPGFVDALASLLLVIIFVLLVFALAQFFLGATLSDRDASLRSLQGEMAKLADVLALERKAKDTLNTEVARLQGELQATLGQRRSLEEQVQGLTGRAEQAEAGLAEEKKLSESARAAAAQLDQQLSAMRAQLAQLVAALEASEKKAAEQDVQIQTLGQRLNAALAGKVQELARFRSEFFGRLRTALGDRPDIRIEGDRFIFASEVLFDPGSAELGPAGRAQVQRVAETLKQVAKTIPPDIDWILQIDGHTDRTPIATPQFPSNWELSQARAMSVLRLLHDSGIPAARLAAAGYAEYKPLDPGDTEAAFRRNRRIELKLTQR